MPSSGIYFAITKSKAAIIAVKTAEVRMYTQKGKGGAEVLPLGDFFFLFVFKFKGGFAVVE
jgi:hypothetical protein